MQPFTANQRAAHLERIGILGTDLPNGGGPAQPSDVALVADLQLAHLLHVPFENLDIHLGRPIVLDPDRIHAKVIEARRGGYCYELNSLFARLLGSFGFDPTLVSARVASDDGTLSARFDHLALLVQCRTVPDGETVDHLVDVGFGDAFTRPVPLIDGAVHQDRDRRVRLRAVSAGAAPEWSYEEDRGDGWNLRYRFETVRQDLSAFAERNEWQQTSPDSHFTRQLVASLLTSMGRVTLSGPPLDHPPEDRPIGRPMDRLIVTALDGERREEPVEAHRLRGILVERFGIDVPVSRGDSP